MLHKRRPAYLSLKICHSVRRYAHMLGTVTSQNQSRIIQRPVFTIPTIFWLFCSPEMEELTYSKKWKEVDETQHETSRVQALQSRKWLHFHSYFWCFFKSSHVFLGEICKRAGRFLSCCIGNTTTEASEGGFRIYTHTHTHTHTYAFVFTNTQSKSKPTHTHTPQSTHASSHQYAAGRSLWE